MTVFVENFVAIVFNNLENVYPGKYDPVLEAIHLYCF